jgi:hypothetical protein
MEQIEVSTRGRQAFHDITANFASKGLAGLLYWYLLYPIHGLIFSGTIRELVAEAEKAKDQNEAGP